MNPKPETTSKRKGWLYLLLIVVVIALNVAAIGWTVVELAFREPCAPGTFRVRSGASSICVAPASP
jgi:hypothetical protein